MNFNSQNQDDPHGIQALLATLRRQQDGPPSGQVGTASHQTTQSPRPLELTSKSTGVEKEKKDTNHQSAPFSESLRYISLAQALPHLTRLSKDQGFLSSLLQLKAQQDSVEEKLAEEREKLLQTVPGPSAKKVKDWDKKALHDWDILLTEQQRRLEMLGVPCFFETGDPSQRKKQDRVFQVLAGLLE